MADELDTVPPVQAVRVVTAAAVASSLVWSGALGAAAGALAGGPKRRGKGALIGAGVLLTSSLIGWGLAAAATTAVATTVSR